MESQANCIYRSEQGDGEYRQSNWMCEDPPTVDGNKMPVQVLSRPLLAGSARTRCDRIIIIC